MPLQAPLQDFFRINFLIFLKLFVTQTPPLHTFCMSLKKTEWQSTKKNPQETLSIFGLLNKIWPHTVLIETWPNTAVPEEATLGFLHLIRAVSKTTAFIYFWNFGATLVGATTSPPLLVCLTHKQYHVQNWCLDYNRTHLDCCFHWL